LYNKNWASGRSTREVRRRHNTQTGFLILSLSKSLRIAVRFATVTLVILGLFDCSPSLGQCRNSTVAGFFNIGVLQGKAFVGERIDVQVRVQSPGMDRVDVYKEKISRDGQGRIRIETHLFSKIDQQETRKKVENGDLDFALPENEISHYIQLMDCITNRTFLGNPDHHTVAVMEITKPAAAQPAVIPYRDELFHEFANVQSQDLGLKEIAGIRSHGFRLVQPARTNDPAKPLTEHDTAVWISQEWALTVKQILRKPEADSLDFMTVLSFRAEEPNPETFAVPPDFKTEITTMHSGKVNESR
jgi:hypothetical protein